jgi:hypothetical protein
MSDDDDRGRIARELWTHIRSYDADNVRNYPAAARAIDSGADPHDLALAMAAASYDATFHTLFMLTGEEDIEALAESGAANMMHEDLLTADPTGREGQDLFG